MEGFLRQASDSLGAGRPAYRDSVRLVRSHQEEEVLPA